MSGSSENKLNFTNKRIEDLLLPDNGKRIYLYDEKVPFLAVQLSAAHKTFYLYRRIQGKPERIKLGFYPEIGVNTARDLAEKMNGWVANGASADDLRCRLQQPTLAQDVIKLSQLFDNYINVKKQHKETWKRDTELYQLYLQAWGRRALVDISKKDVIDLHTKIGENNGKVQANRVIALLSSIYGFAEDTDLFQGKKPTKGVKRYPEKSRERFLLASEMDAFFSAVFAENNHTMRDFVLIALFTGARKSTVAAMRWDDIDLDRGIWRMGENKNKTSRWLPLVSEVITILKNRANSGSEWVFPSRFGHGTKHMTQPRKAFDRIKQAANIGDLHIHDLRRSLGSWMAINGQSLLVIGKALNHKNPASTAIYARLDSDPVRKGMEQAIASIRSNIKGSE